VKLLVFGASGRTGQELVRQALAHNHLVTAFTRRKEKIAFKHANLNVVSGNVAVKPVVEMVVPGHDAVVSTLGVSTPLEHDQKVIDGIQHIVDAMTASGIDRFIYQSFIGVRESRAAVGFLLRYLAPIPLRHEIADHELKEAIIFGSALQWTIVRPPTLTNAKPKGVFRSGETIHTWAPLPMMSRADVASFMLNEISAKRYVRRAVRLLP